MYNKVSKKLIKRSSLLIILLCCFALVKAQDITPGKAFSLGAELGIPNASAYNIGVGLSAKGELPVSDRVSITVTGGYTAFFYRSNFFGSKTLGAAQFIPLKAGAEYYLSSGVYLAGELGTAIETNYLKRDLFAFSIGPGFIIPINDKHGIDFSLRYEKWSNNQVQQTAIRFAYRLGW